MKTIKWFTDTETTGLLKSLDQILSYSVVLEHGSKTIEAYEKRILLKENILPHPNALVVNKINPFSSFWKNQSISEYDAYTLLKNVFKKLKLDGYRIIMIAYNLAFDYEMYKDLFLRYGDNFDEYVTVKFDPLITVKRLLDQKKLVTREVQTAYSKSYMTAKLEEVFKALGYDSSQFQAHTALDDTLMLQMVTHGIYYLALDKKLDDMDTAPELYTVGQNKHVIVEDLKIGAHKKLIKILFNDIENQRLLVLDNQKTVSQSPETCVDYIPYSDILDETTCDDQDDKKINSFYQTHNLILTEAANSILAKKEKAKKEVKEDFKAIEKLAEKMISSNAKKSLYKQLTPEELKLLPKAEEYSYGKHNKGWSRDIFGKNLLTDVTTIDLGDSVVVELDSIGTYVLKQENQVLLNSEKKTLLQEKICEILYLTKEDEKLKEIMKSIPSVASFKNSKHPKLLLEEFENVKAEAFGGSDKFKKDLVSDLLNYYKQQAPEVYGDINLPSFKLDLSSLLKKKD